MLQWLNTMTLSAYRHAKKHLRRMKIKDYKRFVAEQTDRTVPTYPHSTHCSMVIICHLKKKKKKNCRQVQKQLQVSRLLSAKKQQ